jgi:hypothetical protein
MELGGPRTIEEQQERVDHCYQRQMAKAKRSRPPDGGVTNRARRRVTMFGLVSDPGTVPSVYVFDHDRAHSHNVKDEHNSEVEPFIGS